MVPVVVVRRGYGAVVFDVSVSGAGTGTQPGPADAARRVAALAGIAVEVVEAQSVEDLTRLVTERGLAALGAYGGSVAVRGAGDVLHLTITDSLGERVLADYTRMPLHGPLPTSVAAATGMPVLLPDRTASLAFAPGMDAVVAETGCEAWAALPLRGADGRILGSLTAGWTSPHAFPPDEVGVLEAFAAHCAHGIERITARRAERATAAATHRMAEVLQLSLLTDPVQPGHLQVAVRYLPAAHDARIGGDWYDAFMSAGGDLSLVIGDATGHDRDAAAVMGQLRNLLRGLAYALKKPPAPILTALDEAMEHFAVGSLATAILAQVEQNPLDKLRGVRRLRWSNAGHPPPLLLHVDGVAELLETEPELLLGVGGGRAQRHDHMVPLPVGSTLLLYTDGLVERRGSDLDLDLERLRRTVQDLAGNDLESFCDALIDRMRSGVDDDIALLAVRAHDPSRPRPPEAGPERLR